MFLPLFAGCPVMEPPEPVNISGTINVAQNFSNWSMTKVIAIDSKGVVVGETVPVFDGKTWNWQIPAVTEDGEVGMFWVEMKNGTTQPVYYNQGTQEKFEVGANIKLEVKEKYIPVKNGNDLGLIGKDSRHTRSDSYILIRDIRLGGDWEPLCKSGAEAFSGVLKGNGHTVSGLKLADTGNFQYVGLFGYLDGAKIEKLNLVITNTNLELSVASEQGLGALAGFAKNTSISGVEVSGPSKGLKVKKPGGGNFYVGGVAGKIAGSSIISRSATRFSIEVDADSTGACYLGGIAGYVYTTGAVSISKCYNSESIDLNINGTDAFVGGILGFNESYAQIEQCYATGNVSASVKSTISAGTVAAGGLVGGDLSSDITSSCALMETVSASSSPNAALTSSGGLCGVGTLSAGTASCYQLNTMTITPGGTQGMDAANTVSKSAINVGLFTGTPLNWDFTATWVWDGQRGYPVFR